MLTRVREESGGREDCDFPASGSRSSAGAQRRLCLFPTSALESSVCALLNREDLSLPLEMLKIRDFLSSHKRLLNKSMKFSVSGLKKKPVNLLN